MSSLLVLLLLLEDMEARLPISFASSSEIASSVASSSTSSDDDAYKG